ncbi:MAG: hypothetical protein IPK20_01310 [Betaproteobacteria bacterium]|nr:hypothetical protein [Betaproteobacteria bacterium]
MLLDRPFHRLFPALSMLATLSAGPAFALSLDDTVAIEARGRVDIDGVGPTPRQSCRCFRTKQRLPSPVRS